MLQDSMQSSNTTGSCAYACVILKKAFQQFTEFNTHFRGGDGLADGGYMNEQGQLFGHYWLEVNTPSETYVVDITADQFGGEAVIIIPHKQATQYLAGNQDTIDEHFVEIIESITQS